MTDHIPKIQGLGCKVVQGHTEDNLILKIKDISKIPLIKDFSPIKVTNLIKDINLIRGIHQTREILIKGIPQTMDKDSSHHLPHLLKQRWSLISPNTSTPITVNFQ